MLKALGGNVGERGGVVPDRRCAVMLKVALRGSVRESFRHVVSGRYKQTNKHCKQTTNNDIVSSSIVFSIGASLKRRWDNITDGFAVGVFAILTVVKLCL